MKYVKVLWAAALAAAALLVITGSAMATTVTSPTGTTYTGSLKATSTGHGILHNPIAKIECNVLLEGPIESHGISKTAVGKATGVVISSCTNSWHVTTVTTGQIVAHWTSGYNGTLTSTGTTAEATRLGVSCRYATNETWLGTVTGGNPAKLHLEAQIPFHEGSALCGTGPVRLTGGGESTPSAIYLDE